MTSDNVDEITELGMSFNIMIGKIKELLDSKMKEQQELKSGAARPSGPDQSALFI